MHAWSYALCNFFVHDASSLSARPTLLRLFVGDYVGVFHVDDFSFDELSLACACGKFRGNILGRMPDWNDLVDFEFTWYTCGFTLTPLPTV